MLFLFVYHRKPSVIPIKFLKNFDEIMPANELPRRKQRGIKPYRFRITLQLIRVIRVICEICGLTLVKNLKWVFPLLQ